MTIKYEMSITEANMLIDILDTEDWAEFVDALDEAQDQAKTESPVVLEITISKE